MIFLYLLIFDAVFQWSCHEMLFHCNAPWIHVILGKFSWFYSTISDFSWFEQKHLGLNFEIGLKIPIRADYLPERSRAVFTAWRFHRYVIICCNAAAQQSVHAASVFLHIYRTRRRRKFLTIMNLYPGASCGHIIPTWQCCYILTTLAM